MLARMSKNSRITPRYTLVSEKAPGVKLSSPKVPPTPVTKRIFAPMLVTKVAMNNQPKSLAVF